MSCSVAVPNSPVFSPSSSLFFNKNSILSPFHETLTLNQTHLNSSQCSSSPSSSSPSSPSSPFSLRVSAPVDSSTSLSPGTVLKRNRPTKLHIPVSSLGFTTSPETPTPAVRRDLVEVERDGYSVYCKRGRREAMEDRYSAALNLQGDPKQAFFGVYDGHGGAQAAQYAADNLEKNILDEIMWNDDGDDDMEEAIKTGYLNTDSDFLKEDICGGSCCVTALIRNGNIVVSNAGDCRAVVSRRGTAEALTSDHRPSREDERDRIQNLSGYVDICRGVWRIQGSLAVSRGIGDRHLKQWVIAEPETKILQIKPEHEFLILASDGLWDKVTNQEAVDVVRTMCLGVEMPEVLVACKKLVEVAVSRGSYDDISVMLIPLSKYI